MSRARLPRHHSSLPRFRSHQADFPPRRTRLPADGRGGQRDPGDARIAATTETGWLADLIYTGGVFRSGLAMFADANGRIARFSSEPQDIARATRLPNRAILPGLVNVHSHTFQRVIRGRT